MNTSQEGNESTGMSIRTWALLLVSVLILGLYTVIIILAWHVLAVLAPFFAVFLGVLAVVAPLVFIVLGAYHWYSHIESKKLQARIVRPTANNMLPALIDRQGRTFIQGTNGELPAPAYQSYAPHQVYHNDLKQIEGVIERLQNVKVQEIEGPAAPVLALPSIESFYQAIPYNSLQVGMGIEAASGKLVLAPIRQSTHFKLIGGSGMGKSCVSAAMLDIAIARNDPDHLKIGLLDLEHNTSRLFENAPHIAEIGPKRQRLIGRDPDEVAQKLKLLQWELTRRAQLGEEHCKAHEPILLVYVEEMLALKYEVVDAKLNKEMLAAINILGVRARKYGIFLLACMQTDYSDKSTREAMAQFRTRGGFAIDPDTARASGFFNNDLIKQNFADGRSGQYVLEKPGFSGLVLAPEYDVALKLEQLATTSPAATVAAPIRLRALPSEAAYVDAEGDTEGAIEAVQELPLRRASQADGSTFTAQEQRFISKFLQEDMGIGQIVSSEFTNAKGEPLTGGEAYKQRSKDVQNVIRRYMDAREVS